MWLDEGINVFLVPFFRLFLMLPPAAGSAHYTVSQTLSELRERGSVVGCVGCKILTWIQNHWPFNIKGDHCTQAMQGVPQSENVG